MIDRLIIFGIGAIMGGCLSPILLVLIADIALYRDGSLTKEEWKAGIPPRR